MKKKYVIHQLSLVSIGGIQSTFQYYSSLAHEKSKFTHIVFTKHKIDKQYEKELKIQIRNLNNPLNFISFCFHLLSKNSVVNFYNNISSKKIHLLLKILPVRKILFHERGNAWNIKSNQAYIYKFNTEKASLIVANSKASKSILFKKFGVNTGKIKVIYNGVLENIKYPNKKLESKINIGFIGRLDTNKGVNIFIESAKKLNDYNFNIAGTGPLEEYLKSQCAKQENVRFYGRIENPYEFLKNQDLLIVPSIREPYGNVIVEAGIMKVPVIASKIDGIPEIIKDGISGVLIEPKDDLDYNLTFDKTLPYPEFVVNSEGKLTKPNQLSPKDLIKEISSLLKNKDKMKLVTKNLYSFVKKNNTVEKYYQSLEKIFNKLLLDK